MQQTTQYMSGYQRLKLTLEALAKELSKCGKTELASDVLRASKFYGGMPSEFMGESWKALKQVLLYKSELPSDITA